MKNIEKLKNKHHHFLYKYEKYGRKIIKKLKFFQISFSLYGQDFVFYQIKISLRDRKNNKKYMWSDMIQVLVVFE